MKKLVIFATIVLVSAHLGGCGKKPSEKPTTEIKTETATTAEKAPAVTAEVSKKVDTAVKTATETTAEKAPAVTAEVSKKVDTAVKTATETTKEAEKTLNTKVTAPTASK